MKDINIEANENILIIGSGIAGLSAAISAAERGMQAVLVSPYASERAQSVMAAGGVNAATTEEDAEAFARDTYEGGGSIEDMEMIRSFCRATGDNLAWLERMGVRFTRDESGALVRRKLGGHSTARTAFAGTCTGKQIVSALIQKCREYEIKGLVTRRTGLVFHSAIIDGGVCYGALFLDERTNKIETITAGAVIVATGGQNKLFGKTTGSELCDGYVAAKLFTQGAALRNLEFIQYHPTSIETEHKRMLISEAARGEGGRLFYAQRTYFMEERFGEGGNLMPRDVVAACINEAPSQVYLDISFLGERVIDERLAEVRDLCQRQLGIDPAKEPIPVAPTIHFFMGGLKVNAAHETNVANLYAIGECASAYHGANRLGGNSLMAAVHSARVAVRACADTQAAEKNALPQGACARIADDIFRISAGCSSSAQNEIDAMLASKSKFPGRYILHSLIDTMNSALGIIRDGEALKKGLAEIDYLIDVENKINYDPTLSLYENYRLGPMLVLAKAILMSAEHRKESRGAHKRSDFPEREAAFAKESVAIYEDGQIRVTC